MTSWENEQQHGPSQLKGGLKGGGGGGGGEGVGGDSTLFFHFEQFYLLDDGLNLKLEKRETNE